MTNDNTSIVALQLDVGEAVAGVEELSDVLNGLKRAAGDLGATIFKAFVPIHGSLKSIQSGVDNVSTACSKLVDSLTKVKSSSNASKTTDVWFVGITSGYDSLKKFIDGLEKTDAYSGKFHNLFENMVEAPNVGKLVESVLPKTTELFDTISKWTNENIISSITRVLGNDGSAVGEGVSKIVGSISSAFKDVGTALGGMSLGWGAAIGGIITLIVLLVQNWDTVQAAILTAWEAIKSALGTAAEWINTTVIQPIVAFFSPLVEWFAQLFQGIWQTITDVVHNIVTFIVGYVQIVQTIWGAIGGWLYDHVIRPVADFFAGLWEGFANKAKEAWEGVKTVFGAVAGFFGKIFGDAWAGIVNIFSAAGSIFTDIKDGILTAFKNIINGIITGINNVVAVPFNGINFAIEKIRNINILGIAPFTGLKTINVPQIPYLAKGAVLPANRPFLAMVGDQRHGTNIEAPLATIQEAVALVMQDQTAAILSGVQASVGIQREILEAVLGIQIGDDVIGRATARYNRKMAIAKGGI